VSPVTSKVVKAEKGRMHRGGLSWYLDLACGHHKEVSGWGSGAGMNAPARSVCYECTRARNAQVAQEVLKQSAPR